MRYNSFPSRSKDKLYIDLNENGELDQGEPSVKAAEAQPGELLDAARQHAEDGALTIDYRECSAEELAAEQAGSYDLVTCLEMLEHVPDPASIVEACAALVKPGGEVLFSTINRQAKSFAFSILGAEYVLGLVPRGTHEYDKFIRPSELAGWCRQAGLDLHGMTGLTYNPLTRVYKLDDEDVDVNYFARTIRPE